MKRRVLVALLVVAVAMTAQAAHIDDGSTTVQQSECYTCHFEGGSGLGPALKEMFRIIPEPVAIKPGETAPLEVTVRNWWTSELSRFQGRLDLSDAPAFAFADTPEPVLDQRLRGEIPFQLSQINAPERSDAVVGDIPVGGTDLVLRLIPDTQEGAEAPDLIFRVWRPDADTREDPTFEVDQTGAGEIETLRISAEPVPHGKWTFEAVQAGFTSGADQSKLASQGFVVSWDLLYEYDDPVRFATSSDVLDGQDQETNQATRMSWPVQLVQPIETTQRIHVEVVARSFYDHPEQFGAADEWFVFHERVIVIEPPVVDEGGEPTDGNGTVNFGGDEEPDGPDLTEDTSNPASVWGEIVGYFAAFLLVLSLLSGGAFGHWSRRLQNWMLFRKSKRRVAFHNFVSYNLTAAAIVHLVIFLVESRFPWSLGMLLGGASLLGMLFAGLTGAFQVGLIRRVGHEAWRWMHWLSFFIAFGGAVAHIVLDGIHFTEFQDMIGWEDPLRPILDDLISPSPAVQT